MTPSNKPCFEYFAFGFTYMYIFYDAYSKLIAVYYGRSTLASEMADVFKQFLADFKRPQQPAPVT